MLYYIVLEYSMYSIWIVLTIMWVLKFWDLWVLAIEVLGPVGIGY